MAYEYWFRVEEHLESNGYVDVSGDYVRTGSTVRVTLQAHRVVKVTPYGVRLDNGMFIHREWNKRFAAPTKSDAVTDFIARKKRQIRVLTGQLETAREALKLVEGGKLDTQEPQ